MTDLGSWVGLAGVAVGVCGTLGAQLIASRSESARNRALARERDRAELVAAINRLILAAQLAEEAAAHFSHDGPHKGSRSSEMWAAYKSLSLLAGRDLMDPAASFCNKLNDCLWSPSDRPAHVRIRETQGAFMDAARIVLHAPD